MHFKDGAEDLKSSVRKEEGSKRKPLFKIIDLFLYLSSYLFILWEVRYLGECRFLLLRWGVVGKE